MDLANRLEVSSVTIRKDLSDLEEKELLYRSHGSAILINPYINDRHVNVKEQLYMDEKRRIGARAAELITENDTIIIASGTTVHAFTRQIRVKEHLTVISASMTASSILARDRNIDVIQLGGFVRNTSLSAVGNYAEKMLEDFSCSKLFLGVDGIDHDYGLTTTNAMEAMLNRVMMRVSQRTIVLADSSKFGRRGFSKICDTDSIDHIVTDDKIPPKTLENLTERGIEVSTV
jgi:DeoR family transcriptional regulator of aga operon